MALFWTLATLIVLAFVLVVIRIIRNLTFGTFVAGGRNRKTRLAVMDATAVDSHRRLVLVRRDDVEHLLLIGGPTDVVVEQDIRFHVQTRRGGPEPHAEPPSRGAERSRPTEVPQATPPRPQPRQPEHGHAPDHPPKAPPPRQVDRSAPQLVRPQQPEAAPRPAPVRQADVPARQPEVPPASVEPRLQPRMPAANGPTALTRAAPVAPQKNAPHDDLDARLMEDLEVNVENGSSKKVNKPEMSLEDEMTKLLGELSAHKR